MKKIFTFFTIAVIFISFTYGKQIDEQTAKAVGQSFLMSRTGIPALKSASGLELVYRATAESSYNHDFPGSFVCFYVFNITSPQGYIIVAGDDQVIPVIGYSDQKTFNPCDIPQNVARWLEGYKSQIRHAVEKNIPATDGIKSEWQNLLSNGRPDPGFKSKSFVNPLIQTQWDQSPLYNDLCPYDYYYNDRTVTGCVATAMAQIMKYWNYPATGSGFHSYDHNTYGTLSANFGGTTYEWASMPNMLSGPNNALATLMYHCGVSVDMNYGVGSQGGSSAYMISSQSPVTNCAEYALKEYFNYPASLQGLERASYSDDQWINLLKTELDASRPVLYAGLGSGGGHCFVCDGYEQNDYFHFNWGWSGSYDGYFTIDALNPGGVGTGGGTGGFNSGQQAVIGIQAPSGTQTYDLRLYNYVTLSASTIYYGQAFTVWTDIGNYGNSTFNGDYCAAIFDNNYAFVDFVEVFTGQTLEPGYHYANGITFSSDGLLSMLPGTYYIGVFFRPTGDNWYQVDDNSGYTNLVQMNVINPNDIELYEAMSLTPGTTLIQGESVSVHLDVANYGSTTFEGILDVSLYNLDGSFAFTIEEKNNINLPPNTHFTNGLTFINANLTADPGTYLLAIQHKATGGDWELTGSSYYQNPIFVTVQSEALYPDIYEPNNSVAESYNLSYSFSGNFASINTPGSNCHQGNDYDYYVASFPQGFTYTINARIHDSRNSGTGSSYSLDGILSYSTDGTTNMGTFDDIMPYAIILNNGGIAYFLVSPKYTGETGTYLLELNIARNPVGIGETAWTDRVSIYPNPASDFINIDLEGYHGTVDQVQLVDSKGQLVIDISPAKDQPLLKFAVGDLSEGSYFLQLRSDAGFISRKVIIRR